MSEDKFTEGYDHNEVRCDQQADWDCDNLMVGEPRTCCVCAGHDCEEAKAERAKHPEKNNEIQTIQ